MKVTVIETFEDKFGNHHTLGDVIEVSEDRIKNLESKKLIEVVKNSTPAKKTTKK